MANLKKIYLYCNYETGKFTDLFGNALSSGDWAKLFLNEKIVILCISFRDNLGSPAVFNETDTFDLAVDTDYIKSIQNAQLNAGLSGAVTIIPVKSTTETPALTGTVRLTNTAGDTEDVDYTDYTLANNIYSLVVSHTLDHIYLENDGVVFLEPLMIYADNSKVNMSGDWSAASKTGGKLSFRIACNTPEAEEKLGNSEEIEAIVEARRYISGDDSIILQDGIQYHNIINDSSPSPSQNDPLYRTAAAQDSKDNLKYLALDELLASGRDIEFSIDGVTSWHATQTAEDMYWRERYPGGAWSVAIRLPDGAKGDQGVSMRLKGVWDSGTAYVNDATYIDVVTDSGNVYACVQSGTNHPVTDPAYWLLIVSKGDKGDQGVSMRLKGVWDSGTAYVNDATYIDVVTDSGNVYACVQSGTNHPVTDPAYWLLIVSKGAKGDQGDIGASVLVKGSVATVESLPGGASVGDLYIVIADGHGYGWNGATWEDCGLMRGTAGADGVDGATWRSGSAVPDNGVGTDGDFYFRDTTSDVYLRSAGTYSIICNNKGLPGDPGADGANGSNITFQGVYNAGTTYDNLAGVTYSDEFYSSLQGSNIGHTPGEAGSETWWLKVVAKGDNPFAHFTTPLYTDTGTVTLSGDAVTPSHLTIGPGENTFSGTTSGQNTGDIVLASPNHGLSLTNQTLAMGTPSSISGVTTNLVSSGTHTHELSGVTGSGSVVLATSPTISFPTLTAPVLGAATASSINKVIITAPAATATLTIANGATLTCSATAGVSGTNTGDVTLSANSGLVVTAGQVLYMGTPNTITSTSTNTVSTNTHSHAITAGVGFVGNGTARYQTLVTQTTPFAPIWTTATGTGIPVFADNATMTNPTLGNAHVTTVNKVTITAPANAATLTIANYASLVCTATANISGTNTGDQTGGTPALTLGTVNTAGVSTNFLRRDDTILVFDATYPATQAFADTAVVGTATVAARRDHKHAMPAAPTLSGLGGVPTSLTISTTAPLSGGGDLTSDRTLTTSMATNKLIGRGTAGTGVMEEITLGSGLTLAGTTLNATTTAGLVAGGTANQVLAKIDGTDFNTKWMDVCNNDAGNGARYDSGSVVGWLNVTTGSYTGQSAGQTLTPAAGITPHVFVSKSITAVIGNIWTCLGGNKSSALANITGGVSYGGGAADTLYLGTNAAINTNAATYRYFALSCHDGSKTKARVIPFSYTGNGAARTLTGLGADLTAATHAVVIIKGAGAQSAVFRTTAHTGTTCSYFVIATADIASGGIESFDTDGFSVGTNAAVNTNAVVYEGAVILSDASGTAEMVVGEYAGVGGSGQGVMLPSLVPSADKHMPFFLPAGALQCHFKKMSSQLLAFISAATADVAGSLTYQRGTMLTLPETAAVQTANSSVVFFAPRCTTTVQTLT